jgi:predicted nucleotidyltransferase
MDSAYHVNKARLKSLARVHQLDLVVLFGSHAKQRAIVGKSDVDVAVHFADRKYKRGKSQARLYADLAAALQPTTELDLTILNSAGPMLMFEVARYGKALYQKSATSFAQFKYAAGRAYDDNQKYFAARERYMKAKYGG